MTRLELIDNAIKIVAPAAIAAGATLFAVFLGRSAERKKDARKRRQDGLEKIVDGFEEGHAVVAATIAVFWTFGEFAISLGPDVARSACSAEAERLADAYEPHIGKLSMLTGRAQMLDLNDIAALLERVATLRTAAIKLLQYNDGAPSKVAIAGLRDICTQLENNRTEFHAAAKTAFYAI